MGYELRTQTVEPKRNTFQHLIDRFGDKPATRYQEGTFNIQAMEHFHYRPYWDPAHEIYDPDYSALKLVDPYVYTDPRQYYYATYVTARAAHYEAFARTLSYIEERRLFDRLPENWHALLVYSVIPLRHYESGAELISVNGCRFAWGTSIAQACGFAGFDRIGNAQLLSLVGLSLGGGSGEKLREAKQHWLDDPYLQPLRQFVEEALIEKDWAAGVLALEIADAQLYPLLFRHLDERALFRGAGAYSLIAQHFSQWFTDQQKWLTPLIKTWLADEKYGEANRAALAAIADRWFPQARDAVRRLAAGIEKRAGSTSIVSAADRFAAEEGSRITGLGVPLKSTAEGART